MRYLFALAVLAASLLPSESQACFRGRGLFSRGGCGSQATVPAPTFQLGVRPVPEAKTIPVQTAPVQAVTVGDCANGQCGQSAPARTFRLRGLFGR